jgi:hypothetical protein
MTSKKLKYLILVTLQFSVCSIFSQDLKLWYKQPAIKWTEALPIGNGRIGAMIFGGIENDRVQFNEETLWTGEPRSYSRPGAYKYLDTIRQLLFAGKQKEAEALAEKEFMGLKSFEGERSSWINKVTTEKKFAVKTLMTANGLRCKCPVGMVGKWWALKDWMVQCGCEQTLYFRMIG